MADIALLVSDAQDLADADEYWADLFTDDGDTVTLVDVGDWETYDFSAHDLVAVRSAGALLGGGTILEGLPVLTSDNALPNQLGMTTVAGTTLTGGLTHIRPHNPPFSDSPYDDETPVQINTSGNLFRYLLEKNLTAGTIAGAYDGLRVVIAFRVDDGVVRVFFGPGTFTNRANANFDEMLLRAKDLALSGADPTDGDPNPPPEIDPLPGEGVHPMIRAPEAWYTLIQGVELDEPFMRESYDFPMVMAPESWYTRITGIEEWVPLSARQVKLSGSGVVVPERYINVSGTAVRVTRYINVSGDPVEIVPGE